MRILVVEDSAMASMIIVRHLNEIGYQDITEATNGKEALRRLERQQYDLVITDWMMNKGDGLTLIKALRMREKGRRTPIIMVTAKGLQVDIKSVIEAGVNDYIVKPVRRDVLKEKIERILVRDVDRNGKAL